MDKEDYTVRLYLWNGDMKCPVDSNKFSLTVLVSWLQWETAEADITCSCHWSNKKVRYVRACTHSRLF